MSKSPKNSTDLSNELNIAIDWFRENQMIVNPDKFQVIIFHKQMETITLYP